MDMFRLSSPISPVGSGQPEYILQGSLDHTPSGQAEFRAPLTERTYTQQDQDKKDDAARRKATKDLVQSWMDRLQLITVITTFFASTEAGLLQITSPNPGQSISALEKAANAGLVGALVVHVNAAIISFLAAFLLIRYRIDEAKKEEEIVEEGSAPHPSLPPTSDPEKASQSHSESRPRIQIHASHSNPQPHIESSDPHLAQVGPWGMAEPPMHLLQRFHGLCVGLTVAGFILALMGIVCYAWAWQPQSVGIFATICMGVCVVIGALVLLP